MGPHPVDAAAIEFKPGKGLSVTSADGDFELTTRLRTQWLATVRNDHNTDKVYDTFEVRRLRLSFEGAAFGKHNRFKVEMGFGGREDLVTPGAVAATNASVSPVLDAYAEFDYERDATFRIGQYKILGRQRVMSEGNLQLVDVSAVTTEFTPDRDLGMDVRSKDLFGANLLRYQLGLYTGQGKDTFSESKFRLTYLGRVEVLPLGLYDDTVEQDFERTGPRLGVGVTAMHQTEAPRDRGSVGAFPGDGGSTDLNELAADANFRVSGLSATTEFFYRHGDRNAGGVLDATKTPPAVTVAGSHDGIGWYAQAGYLLPGCPFEISARGGIIRGRTVAFHNGLRSLNELGGGVGYYVARNPLKIQADYFRLHETTGSGTRRNDDQIRVQLQLAL